MAITTRAGKGGPLTHAEMDTNFTDLRDGVDMMVPKDPDAGIKVDSLGTPTFGWHDLLGTLTVPDQTAPDAPTFVAFRGVVKQYQFDVDDTIQFVFHLPHDYALGTNIFIHVHWSHASTDVTGGSVTWGFELTYSKGHNQQSFTVPVTIVEIQNASTSQYRHMVCEAPASIPGGGPNLLDTDQLETDGLLIGQLRLVANDMTASGPVPAPFVHTVDLHYQSTGVPTKNRAPNFWGL